MVRPTISVQAVRDALDGLLYTSRRAHQTNALHVLALVDEFVADPALPAFEHARSFALNNLLTELITQEFSRLRESLNRPAPDPSSPITIERKSIEEDGATRAVPLIAWGYLYYRYVRVDLNLSPDEYASYVKLDTRTMRRYQVQAVEALTEELVVAEWKARTRLRKRRLYNVLPIIPTVKLFGREEAFQTAYEAFARGYRQIFITGEPGTGKTVFAQELVRQLIEGTVEPFVENVVWINSPTSTDELIRTIYERVCPIESPLSLRDCLSQYRTVIVVDDLSDFPMEELDATLGYLSAAEIIFTNHHFIPLRNPVAHLTMHELTQDEANAYIQWLQIKEKEVTVDPAYIYKGVGGNPLAIKLMVNEHVYDATNSYSIYMKGHPFDHDFETITQALKKAWASCLLIPSTGLKRAIITRLLGITTSEIAELLTRQVLVNNIEHGISMSRSALQVVKSQYTSNPIVKVWLEESIYLLEEKIMLPDENDISVIEHLLSLDLPLLSASKALNWISLLLPLQRNPRSSRWLGILEKWLEQDNIEPHYYLEYGRTLYHFHQWEKSKLVLEQAIIQAGRQGDFHLQAEAMLQLAILFRSAGTYDRAQMLLVEVLKHATLYKNTDLIYQTHIEIAQIAVQQNDSSRALEALEEVPEHARGMSLKAEAYLLSSQYDLGIDLANHTLVLYAGDRINTSITYLLLGRLYTAAGQYEQAHQAFLSAVILLEGLNHPFVLARAWTNLAVVYIYQDAVESARELLARAELAQINIRDEIGLVFTRYNLRRLDDLL